MDALTAIQRRMSVRRFKEESIDKEIIEKIVDAGRLAATARNIQPWKFVVIKDKKIRADIAKMVPNGPFIEQAPVCIVVLCKDTKYYLEDGCAATQNILVSATALGVGSCWVAGDKKPYAHRICEIVNAPSEYKLVSMIALGYSLEQSSAANKKNLNELLFWEKMS